MENEEHLAAVQAIRDEWRAYADALIAKDRARRGNQPYDEAEVFACPAQILKPVVWLPASRPLSSDSNLATHLPAHLEGQNTDTETLTSSVVPPSNASQNPMPRHTPPLLEPRSGKRFYAQPAVLEVQSTSTNISSYPSSANTTAIASLGPIRKRQRESSLGSEQETATANRPCEAQRSAIAGSLPDWYLTAKRPSQYKARDRDMWTELKTLGKLIGHIKNMAAESREVTELIEEFYLKIDKLRFMDVSPYGLKNARLLDKDHGLPSIFHTKKDANLPYYVINDARGLYKRWMAKIFDGSNMFRGILNMVKGKNKAGHGPSIDKAYKIDWRFFGEGHLVNGDWFANQLCAVRDGAHGSPQGGISGIDGEGATSISMSGDLYASTDKDELDEIWYSGTAQNKKGETERTVNIRLLTDSFTSGHPVRVLRSMHLPKSNPYKPERGFRYDGLYTVKSYECVDTAKHHYLFHLVRDPGQDPVRYKGAEKRPTQNEMELFDREMKNYGKKGIWND